MTTENNKIIAEFMGLKPKCERDGVYSYSDMPFFSIRENDIDKVIEGIAKYSKYHSDWNWLMEVVEKIESLGHAFSIDGTKCYILTNDFCNAQNEATKIESVYKVCLAFIKWYNEQKKE